MTKARACKGANQEGSPGVTSHVPGSVGECEGMNLHITSELPLWELEFGWIPESSESDCRGQTHWIEKIYISLEILWNLHV